MFEFQKLCNTVEGLTPAERGALIAEKSIAVVHGLRALDDIRFDPVDTLAAFIIGSVVSDGAINEKDYLYIYPSLVKAFGEMCDLAGIKTSLKVSADVQKEISSYTRALMSALSEADETLGEDLILLCLLITSADGKISLKEKRYIKQLCRE